MSDDISVKPSVDVTAVPVATDEIAGRHYQRVKLIHGAEGVNDGDVEAANPLPVDGSGVSQPVLLYDANGDPIVLEPSLAELKRIRRLSEDTSLALAETAAILDGRTPELGPATASGSVPVTIASDQVVPTERRGGVLSKGNSIPPYRTILTGQSFLGTAEDVSAYRSVSIYAYLSIGALATGTDVATLTLQWSHDGIVWDSTESYSGNQGPQVELPFSFVRPVRAKYFRLYIADVVADLTYVSIQTTYLDTVPGVTQGRAYDSTNYDAAAVLAPPQGISSLGAVNDIKVDLNGAQYIGGVPTFTSRPRNVASEPAVREIGGSALGIYGRFSDWGGAWTTTGYLTAVVAAAKAANTTLMSFACGTPPSIAGFMTYITRIRIFYEVVTVFAAAAVPSSLVLQRFTGSIPTGGTSRTIAPKDRATAPLGATGPWTNVTDVRDSNAALTGSAPSFGNVIASRLAPTFTVASGMEWELDFDSFGNDALRLEAGDGLALRTGSNAFAATGTWMFSYTIDWISLYSSR